MMLYWVTWDTPMAITNMSLPIHWAPQKPILGHSIPYGSDSLTDHGDSYGISLLKYPDLLPVNFRSAPGINGYLFRITRVI